MKQFMSVILLVLLIGCKNQEVVITVVFPDQPDVNTLVYTVPKSGTFYDYFSDTLKRSEPEKFNLNLKISQPSFLIIWGDNYSIRAKLLIEPGMNYRISIDGQKNVQITGENAKGQMLYTSFPTQVESGLRKIGHPYDESLSLTYIHEKTDELKQDDLLKLTELLDSKEISKSFFDWVQKDRDCYYASLEARFLTVKTFSTLNKPGTEIDKELLENLKRIYAQYPPTDNYLLFSSFWAEYASNYVQYYIQFIQKDFDFQKIRDLKAAKSYFMYVIDESKQYLDGKALELFIASYLYFECAGFQSFDKEFILLFDQFEKEYPQSEYTKYLKPHIDRIIDYYINLEQLSEQTIVFMDNYETFNTLEEVIKPLQGKKIYIDVWAQWCAPCKAEFVHNEALKKILAENNVQLLYISLDKEEDEQKWKDAIQGHYLTGNHIRANKELSDKMWSLVSAIPRYLLIDEKGSIMEEHAKRPSQLVAGEKIW